MYEGTPLESEYDKLKRKRAILNAITAQSMAPYQGTTYAPSGPRLAPVAVDDTLGQGISRIGKALIARMKGKKLDEQEEDLSKRYSEEQRKAQEEALATLRGRQGEVPYRDTAPDPASAAHMYATNPYLKDSAPGMQGVISAMMAPKPKSTFNTIPKVVGKDRKGNPIYQDIGIDNGVPGDEWGTTYVKPVASTNVTNVLPKGEESLVKKFGELQGTDYAESKTKAENAVEFLESSIEAQNLLNKGMVTGQFANLKIGLSKILAEFGIEYAKDPTDNAEAYLKASAKRTLAVMPALGAGSALSDSDREFANAFVGGDITMSEEAIRRLMDINVRYNKQYIERYNEKIGKFRGFLEKQHPNSALLLGTNPIQIPEIKPFEKPTTDEKEFMNKLDKKLGITP